MLTQQKQDSAGGVGRALATPHQAGVAVAVEGLAVLAEDAAPVGERRVRRGPEVVDAVQHDGAQLPQALAQRAGRRVLDVERRPQLPDDAHLELGQLLDGQKQAARAATLRACAELLGTAITSRVTRLLVFPPLTPATGRAIVECH